MNQFPTELGPFLFAILAAAGAMYFGQRHTGAPNGLVKRILWAIAIGCVVIGLALMRLY